MHSAEFWLAQYCYVAKGMPCLIPHWLCKHKNNQSQTQIAAMSTQRKQSVLLIKDKQTIISHLEKGKKGTNLALEFNISKQQISDICKNKETILKFTDSIEMSKGLEIHKYLRSAHKYSSRNQFTIKFVFFIPYTSLYIIFRTSLYIIVSLIFIFDYPDSRLPGLFTQVPKSLDNQGSTAQCIWVYIISESSDSHQHTKEPLAVTIGHLNLSFLYDRIYRYVQ